MRCKTSALVSTNSIEISILNLLLDGVNLALQNGVLNYLMGNEIAMCSNGRCWVTVCNDEHYIDSSRN